MSTRTLAATRAEGSLDLGVLDALRGLAALYVVLFHATLFLWAHGNGVVPGGNPVADAMGRLWLTLMHYGQEAVLLFFVLSGFCIHYRQARRAAAEPDRKRSFNVRDFAWRRFRRLYPVLLVAIVATAGFDYVGSTLNPTLYNGTAAHPFVNDFADRSYSIPTIVGNLLLQSTLIVPAFGSNHPLWSLAYEFWFYALYPAFLLLAGRLGSLRTLAVATCISLLALAITRLTTIPLPYWIGAVIAHWAIWVAGAAIAELYVQPTRMRAKRWLGIAGGLVLAGLVVMRPGGGPGLASWQDLVWGMAFAALLGWTMFASPNSRVGSTVEAAARFFSPLGAISYSLYVLHVPWLIVLTAWWLAGPRLLPLGLELVALGVVTSLALAGGCWYLVERHFVTSRRKTESRSAQPVAHWGVASGPHIA
jgi:peptidoglycan/LPS O-acetylase OafA/YrhL